MLQRTGDARVMPIPNAANICGRVVLWPVAVGAIVADIVVGVRSETVRVRAFGIVLVVAVGPCRGITVGVACRRSVVVVVVVPTIPLNQLFVGPVAGQTP